MQEYYSIDAKYEIQLLSVMDRNTLEIQCIRVFNLWKRPMEKTLSVVDYAKRPRRGIVL
jgi:hypothetical protein